MERVRNKEAGRKRIKMRIRRKMNGTAEKPRLAVFRSDRHIYAQAVDDSKGRTLASASTRDPGVRGKAANGGNVAAAKVVGAEIAAKLREKGVEQVVFDRGGFLYHGRVKALADAAREGGLKF